MGISLEWRVTGNAVAVLSVSGRSSVLDGSIVQQTVRRLMREGNRNFVFNLSNLEYLDSLGMGQLVSAYLSVRDRGGDVKLVDPVGPVKDLLQNTRLNTVLEVFATDEDAIRSLERS